MCNRCRDAAFHYASLREQPVTDVARGGRQPEASRLAPLRPVDLTLVSDLQPARRLARHENGIAHPAARTLVFLPDFLPKLQLAEPQARQFLADLPLQALFRSEERRV